MQATEARTSGPVPVATMKVADEAWVAVALLHREHPERDDFSVQEIKGRARKEVWGQSLRPGFNQHVSHHCVASKSPDPANHRMLSETTRGRRRLFRDGDPFHPDRAQGKTQPQKWSIPHQYHSLLDWYNASYSRHLPRPVSAMEREALAAGHDTAADKTEYSPLPLASFVGSGGTFVIPEGLRKELGIREGTRLGIYREKDRLVLQPITKEFIRSLVGCAKGETSLVEAREHEHRMEK